MDLVFQRYLTIAKAPNGKIYMLPDGLKELKRTLNMFFVSWTVLKKETVLFPSLMIEQK